MQILIGTNYTYTNVLQHPLTYLLKRYKIGDKLEKDRITTYYIFSPRTLTCK